MLCGPCLFAFQALGFLFALSKVQRIYRAVWVRLGPHPLIVTTRGNGNYIRLRIYS